MIMEKVKEEFEYVVNDYLSSAKGIAWDNCHKIYILMDDNQMELMKEYGYDPLVSSEELSLDELNELVWDWYDRSCGLKFIEVVSTMPEGEDEIEGFVTVVPQGWTDEEEDENE